MSDIWSFRDNPYIVYTLFLRGLGWVGDKFVYYLMEIEGLSVNIFDKICQILEDGIIKFMWIL